MERIFTNSLPAGVLSTPSNIDSSDPDTYESTIKALIEDSVDFSETELALERQLAQSYYDGEAPGLTSDEADLYYDSRDESPEGDDAPAKSSIVSTDVRDTIMTILPSLMRIFAATEHALEYQADSEENEPLAQDATDYIRTKFWDHCDGFLTLYSAFKDALLHKIGVIEWGSDHYAEVREETYTNISLEHISMMTAENPDMAVVDWGEFDPTRGVWDRIAIRFHSEVPRLWVEAVPLDEFRVSRNARSVKTADLIGREQYIRASDLIEMGYDYDEVIARVGTSRPLSVERIARDPFVDQTDVFGDIVRYGTYYVRIDQDGDGIAELRRICTIGDDFYIVEDHIANYTKMAVFGPDPNQYSLIGNSIAELVMDIQRINTSLLRGTLDSLAQSINPKTIVNETLVNIDDALNEDLGAVIRTRGNPHDTVNTVTTTFTGRDAMEVKSHFDMVRAQRTGVSDASRGLDPKALQSTAVMGVDLIATGAQERIELIARIFAETGLKEMYMGLLREVCDNPPSAESMKVRGQWRNFTPSTFNSNMGVKVNPALGKGSDMTRLMALNAIKQDQMMIINKFGLGNGVVGIQEYRNTVTDMLEIANIRNVSRYFRVVDPQVVASIESAPKEPSPEELLAKAEYEKVKKDIMVAAAEMDQKSRKADMDDDFRRDELNVKSFLDLVGILSEYATAEVPEDTVAKQQSLNQPG